MGALDIYVPSPEELEFRAMLAWRQFEKPLIFTEIINHGRPKKSEGRRPARRSKNEQEGCAQ